MIKLQIYWTKVVGFLLVSTGLSFYRVIGDWEGLHMLTSALAITWIWVGILIWAKEN